MGVTPPAYDLPPNSQDWKRYVDAMQAKHEADINALKLSSDNAFQTLSTALTLVQSQVGTQPLVRTYGETRYNIGASSAFETKALVSFRAPRPFGQVMVIAHGVVLDTLTSGVTVAYGRIVLDGQISPEFPATKDSGASQVNNVVVASARFNMNYTVNKTYEVAFQMRGLNGSAYPVNAQNFAAITVLATYTNTVE